MSKPQTTRSISVALVTRNRPASLRRCLESLRSQTVQPFEVLVSDDSDQIPSREVQEMAGSFGFCYITGPHRGLYANRNHAALRCRGNYVLSCDDDHEHPQNYIEQLLSAIELEPQTVWCMGEVYLREAMDQGRAWEGPGQICATGALVPVDESSRIGCWAISDGATLYPRAIFDRGIRYFDGCKFGDSYKEFGCLLHWMGHRIRPLRATGVLHHMNEVGRSFAHCAEERAASLFAVIMFSFFYQPTLRNRLITTMHLFRGAVWQPKGAIESIRLAFRWVRLRQAQARSWRRTA